MPALPSVVPENINTCVKLALNKTVCSKIDEQVAAVLTTIITALKCHLHIDLVVVLKGFVWASVAMWFLDYIKELQQILTRVPKLLKLLIKGKYSGDSSSSCSSSSSSSSSSSCSKSKKH